MTAALGSVARVHLPLCVFWFTLLFCRIGDGVSALVSFQSLCICSVLLRGCPSCLCLPDLLTSHSQSYPSVFRRLLMLCPCVWFVSVVMSRVSVLLLSALTFICSLSSPCCVYDPAGHVTSFPFSVSGRRLRPSRYVGAQSCSRHAGAELLRPPRYHHSTLRRSR